MQELKFLINFFMRHKSSVHFFVQQPTVSLQNSFIIFYPNDHFDILGNLIQLCLSP